MVSNAAVTRVMTHITLMEVYTHCNVAVDVVMLDYILYFFSSDGVCMMLSLHVHLSLLFPI